MSESDTKRANTMDQPTIGTHDGSFHCDEALACFLLRLLPTYKDCAIIRTRNQEKLDTCTVVVDVGGKFDPTKLRFDHHQREFAHTMNSLDNNKRWTTKLSSAGLVYFHFGREIIKEVCKTDDSTTEVLFDQMYDNFVEEIDAVDNGISPHEGQPKYRVASTVGNRVARLNPPWTEKNPDFDAQFKKAMNLVGQEFLEVLNHYNDVWLPARKHVVNALSTRKEVDKSGEIIVFEQACPWKAHLFALEEEADEKINIKYALFTDTHGKWRVMAVPVSPSSFTSRKALPEVWRGLRDQELSDKAGIPGCIFVHASGFIGGNNTKEGALAMARASLKM
ncbi:MYG1 protein [Salpingoeca rosetta]|uniref:MYG1 protein n=1 Tax=Salpingoeca rosetta (strain ATCC 50818 / BSB-021) TaxID=946362 RepID=F2U1C4_SALR5|nr:MYG1 protein [Salpingoeca rosetta]EGD81426.1 MYG1 protein [Salpingoeca rosetta]|eukprot:XP_004996630.1 MYG1 protein [Salpingoeca rosetta]